MTRKTRFTVGSIALMAMLLMASVMYATVPVMGETEGIPTVELKEDSNLTGDLDTQLPHGWYNFSIEGMEHADYILNGSILTIIPEKNWYGSEQISVRYRLPAGFPIVYSNGYGYREVDIPLLLVVDPVNDPPVAAESILQVEFNEDSTYSLDISRYFSDVDSELTYSANAGEHISTSFDGDILVLSPEKQWHGTEYVKIFATDGEYLAEMKIKCTVDPVPEYPENGNTVSVTILEDRSAAVDITDYVPPGWEEIQIYCDYSDILWKLDGNWLYIDPSPNWNGECNISVSLAYASFGDPESPSIRSENEMSLDIAVKVRAVNDPPIRRITTLQTISFSEDTVQRINLNALFYDVDGDPLTYTAASSSPHVHVFVNTSGVLNIEPQKDWYGSTELTIIAYDGIDSTSFVEKCNIMPAPDLTMEEDTVAYFNASDVLPLGTLGVTFSVIEGDMNIEIESDTGMIKAIPGKDWNGKAQIEINGYYWTGPVLFGGFTAPISYSTAYMVPFEELAEINVAPVNDQPKVVSTPSLAGVEDSEPLTIDLSKYFVDIDSGLTYSVNVPEGLSASIDGSILSLSPEPNWFGSVNLTVTASDGEYEVSTEVPVTIKGVDDPPVVLQTAPSEEYIDEDTVGAIDLSQVFADIDSELEYSIETADGLEGKISGSTLILLPVRDWNGDSRVTIVATDGNYTVNRTIHVHILSVDDSPIAKMSAYSVGGVEDNSISLDIGTFFSDVDSILTYSYTGGKHLNVQIDQKGKATITPEKNWHGKSMLCFTASDGTYTTKIPVTVYISPANDMPTSTRDSIVLDAEREEALSIDLSKYFSDPDGDSLTYGYSAPPGVRVSIDGNIATIEVSCDAQPDEKVIFIASDGKSQTSIETHIISMPVESDAQNPPPELPDMSTASTGSGVSPVTAYGAIFLSLGMAALALAYAVLYLRQEKPDRRHLH